MSKNKVKQLRIQLSMSQRELADKAGTSQQQIQRIEAGKITTSLKLAHAICEALGKPFDVVFPEASRALKQLRDEMHKTHRFSDDDLTEASQAGVEPDSSSWTLKVMLRGYAEPLFFPISAAEKRRIFQAVQDENGSNSSLLQFVVFDSNPKRVAINLRELMFCQFLFETGSETKDQEHQEEIRIMPAGGGSPIMLMASPEEAEQEDGEMGQLGHALFMLEADPDPAERLLIVDEDGEDAFIRVGNIALFEVPFWLIGKEGPLGDDEEHPNAE